MCDTCILSWHRYSWNEEREDVAGSPSPVRNAQQHLRPAWTYLCAPPSGGRCQFKRILLQSLVMKSKRNFREHDYRTLPEHLPIEKAPPHLELHRVILACTNLGSWSLRRLCLDVTKIDSCLVSRAKLSSKQRIDL